MKEMAPDHMSPCNIQEIAFSIKNSLRLPDEMFIDFPIRPMDENIMCGNPILWEYGIVKGIRLYYNLYGLFNSRAIPYMSFPANFSTDIDTSFDSIMEKISSAFENTMSGPYYGDYLEYRTAKNIKKKFAAKTWKPVKSKMFTDQEIRMALDSGLFIESELSVMLRENSSPESFDAFLETKGRNAEKYLNAWRTGKIF